MSEQLQNSEHSSGGNAKTESKINSAKLLEPGFGWIPYAEQINGRFAMVGFVALLILELFTQQDFFTWLGLR